MAKTQITTETTNTEPTAKAGNITRRLNPNKSQGEPRGHRRIYSSICKTIQTSLRWSLTILGNKFNFNIPFGRRRVDGESMHLW
jgi:hypothetical protein